jgi:hypothetical protein
MKVDSDLRAAIRAAVKFQGVMTWFDKLKVQQDAIAELLKRNPAIKKRYIAAEKKLAKLRAAKELAENQLYQFGFTLEARGNPGKVRDSEAFAKVGGKLPENYDQRFTEAQVIAELASAPESKRAAILKKYGMVW